jgi:dTMP kinase
LVPREKLENANQVSLLAAYGTAPVAAALFTFLSPFHIRLQRRVFLDVTAVDLALYANALSFAFAAFTIWGLREIPKGAAAKHAAETEFSNRFMKVGNHFHQQINPRPDRWNGLAHLLQLAQ